MPKQKKKNAKICMVSCEWENCQWHLDIEPAEYEIFSDHLKVHADEFVLRLRNDAGWWNLQLICFIEVSFLFFLLDLYKVNQKTPCTGYKLIFVQAH